MKFSELRPNTAYVLRSGHVGYLGALPPDDSQIILRMGGRHPRMRHVTIEAIFRAAFPADIRSRRDREIMFPVNDDEEAERGPSPTWSAIRYVSVPRPESQIQPDTENAAVEAVEAISSGEQPSISEILSANSRSSLVDYDEFVRMMRSAVLPGAEAPGR